MDTEQNLLMQCPSFATSRNCLYGKMSSIILSFHNLTENKKFTRSLCPKTAQEAKLTNKFIKIMFDWREKVDNGYSIENLKIYFP